MNKVTIVALCAMLAMTVMALGSTFLMVNQMSQMKELIDDLRGQVAAGQDAQDRLQRQMTKRVDDLQAQVQGWTSDESEVAVIDKVKERLWKAPYITPIPYKYKGTPTPQPTREYQSSPGIVLPLTEEQYKRWCMSVIKDYHAFKDSVDVNRAQAQCEEVARLNKRSSW